MRAIRVSEFGGPDVLKLVKDLPIPSPTGNQVLIRVHSVGVNPVDALIRSGNFIFSPPLPYTPGIDCAGEIIALSPSIDKDTCHLRVGDRVYIAGTETGAYADHVLAVIDTVLPLPKSLSFAQGAAIGAPYFTAFRVLIHKGKLKAGDVVLIHGASGAVGLACCQIAAHFGARVIGTAGSAEGRELVLKQKAEKVFDHRSPTYVQEILDYTENRGVDIIVEMLADKNLVSDCKLLKPNGIVLIIGSRGKIEFEPVILIGKGVRIEGVTVYQATPTELKETATTLNELFTAGILNPIIAREYPLENAAQAHIDVIQNSGATGKLVLNANE